MRLPSFPFVVLDTETTGFIPKVHRIIEYASVRVRDGKVEDSYETLIGIEDEIPPHVQVLTRIKQGDIAGKPDFDALRDEIVSHIGEDTMIIGQNVGFDIGMLGGEGIDLTTRPWIDTSMIASLVFPELESYSLGYASTVLKLNHEPVHRAMGDVHATLELLEKCWERLHELTPQMYDQLMRTMEKAPEAYRMLFGDLPAPTNKTTPVWLGMPKDQPHDTTTGTVELPSATTGTVNLYEESLDPALLESVIEQCAKDTKTTQWIAVKNLSAFARRATLPSGVEIIRPAYQLLDHAAADALHTQQEYTTDEATLCTKLDWYAPTTMEDMPIHGNERSVWAGKLAGTDSSTEYLAQFNTKATVILVDHRHLLTILADEKHPAQTMLQGNVHILIEDASMLEDTATKAYGYYCNTDDLRAASTTNAELSKFVNVLQLWIEKTRNYQDVRYLTPHELQTPESKGMRAQLAQIIEARNISPQTLRQLEALSVILDPENCKDRIEWIELRQDGKQMLQSVPDRVGAYLADHLYTRYPVTLLIPPRSAETLSEILPSGTGVHVTENAPDTVPIDFLPSKTPSDIASDPPEGKTVLLVSSRKVIETIYVKFAEALEEEGVTLICQGLSGGQGRMQAEFLAAKGTTLFVCTPWMFDTIELQPEVIDHLVIDTLPFDHPAHAVIGKRAERYQNAFNEYSLPRLEHRIFRLLRTFRRYATNQSDVTILDDRLKSKSYGPRVLSFIGQFNGETMPTELQKTTPEKRKPKEDGGQLPLF